MVSPTPPCVKDEVEETAREGIKTLRKGDGKPGVSSLSSKDDDGLWQNLSYPSFPLY